MFPNDLSLLVHQALKNQQHPTTVAEIVKALRDKADAMERAASTNNQENDHA